MIVKFVSMLSSIGTYSVFYFHVPRYYSVVSREVSTTWCVTQYSLVSHTVVLLAAMASRVLVGEVV